MNKPPTEEMARERPSVRRIPLRIGTRSSQLAIWQANWVARALSLRGFPSELTFIETTGDTTSILLPTEGNIGVFTKELQVALLTGHVDLAVHSLKDLPTDEPHGLCIISIPERASPFDVLVSRTSDSLMSLAADSRVGTSSPRRVAQLRHARADLDIVDIRGNVDTRLQKLDDGAYDAIVLAEAGLERLGLSPRITERLAPSVCLPAPGQGALAIEIRHDDVKRLQVLRELNNADVEAATTAERSYLAALAAGCSSPAGAWCHAVDRTGLCLEIVVLNWLGTRKLNAAFNGPLAQCQDLGRRAADWAFENGAAELMSEIG